MARTPIKNVTPTAGSRGPGLRRYLPWIVTLCGALIVCLLFPSILGFVEMASRQLRYLWWLVLIGAVGVYFFFFFGKKSD